MTELKNYAKNVVLSLIATVLFGCSPSNHKEKKPDERTVELYNSITREDKFGSYLTTIDDMQYQVLARENDGIKSLEIDIHSHGRLNIHFVDTNLDGMIDGNPIPKLINDKKTYNGSTKTYDFLPSDDEEETNRKYSEAVKKVLSSIKSKK
ncbi:MAG: hypothetical protein AABX85_02165 [Nanoarchaeota archaeon]